MRLLKAFCLLFALIPFSSFSQRTCATPEYRSSFGFQANAGQYHARITRDTLPGEDIIIPVVVHILYRNNAQNISDAQIRSQIECLNRDFNRRNADTLNTPAAFKSLGADCNIRFCLAKVDPQGRLSTGIVRKNTSVSAFRADDGMKFSGAGGSDAWDTRSYLNIWVCNMEGRSLGYATFPGGPADRDGVVINYDVFGTVGSLRAPFNKGRTATHEVGHWLGLNHTWGDALCGDDGIGDTPPQKSYNFGCPAFPRTSNCSSNQHGDMFMNFMDFSDDACMNIFTNGQKNRMRAQFAINGPRNSLLGSGVCDSANATAPPAVPAPETAPLPGQTENQPYSITVGPNPAQSVITIRGNESFSLNGIQFSITNMEGQQVMQFTGRSSTVTVPISSLKPGVYSISAGSGKDRLVRRFVKL